MKISRLIDFWKWAFAKGAFYSGCCCLLVGIGFGVYTLIFIAQSITASGKVIRLERQIDPENHTVNYTPIFSFIANDGKSYTVRASVASNPSEFEEGQNVRLRYIQSNPMRASIDSITQLWFVPLVLSFLGAVFAPVGFLLLRHMRKRRISVSLGMPAS